MYTIGDFLIRVKNAYLRGAKEVVAPYSKAVVAIGKILVEEHYIKKISVSQKSTQKKVVVELLYTGRQGALQGLRLVSKPSIRTYVRRSSLGMYRKQSGATIVSTSKGIMTIAKAKKQGLGGEVICEVY